MTSTKEAIELITRGTEEILVEEELKILSQGMSEEEAKGFQPVIVFPNEMNKLG